VSFTLTLSSVDIAAMADDLNQNKLRAVINIVDNTVILGSDSPTFPPAQLFASGRARIFFKASQCLKNTFPIISGNGSSALPTLFLISTR
jgi:hypothetical protein